MMKLQVFFSITLLLIVGLLTEYSDAQTTIYPDVPPPAGQSRPARLINFKAGSLIIDMGDHQIENTFVDDQAVPGLFNLHVYGYAVHLLHSGVPLFWAIKANKAKDAIDFSAQTARVHPSGPFGPDDGPWGSTTTALHSFKAGPLIVKSINADAALTVLENLKSSQSGGGRFKSIVIHRLAQDTQIDIRHIILHKPHVFVSIISGEPFDYGPQSNLFAHIGLIQGSVESGGHYELVDQGTRIEDFNEGTCHTLFTEPHIIYDTNDDGSCPRCLPTVPKYREALLKFINAGGNFAAQCAGVTSYENSLWDSQYRPEAGVEGAFLSKYGIKGLGNKGNEWGGRSDDNSLRYPYPDLPVVQFIGDIAGNQTGTITEWYLLGSGAEETLFKNNGHSLVENSKKGQAFRNTQTRELKACGACGDTANNTLPDGRTAFVVTGAKIGTNEVGGMVFYLASHSWWQALGAGTSSSTPSGYVEFASLYNGRRVLLNAMLTPSTRPANCLLSICPDDFECPSKDLLGSCQRCECVDGEEVITTDPSMCGSCEQCISGSCVRNDSLCGACEDCGLNDEGHYWCYEITNENCTSDGGLSTEEKGAVAGAVIGAVLGAVLGAGLAIIGAGVLAWKLLKKPPVAPTIDGVQNMAETDADVNDNKMWQDPVKVFDNQL